MTCHMSLELGGYVLHALEENEEHAVEQHLAECGECLEEVGDLAFAASLLALVRPDAEMLHDHDHDHDEPALPGRATHRLRRRVLTAAAAAVLVGAGVATPAAHLFDGPGQRPQAVVLHGVGRTPPVRAVVDVTARDGSTGLHLSLSGAPTHGWCSLVARATDGRREIAATWPADGLGRVDVSGTTAIPVAELSELSVVTDTGQRLVSIPVPHAGP